jgi:PTS system fructose-specific IIC component/PTS system nitrogen regulatory IIA component
MSSIHLHELFQPDRIRLHMESSDKEQAFEELVDLLVKSYGVRDLDTILRAIRERENKMSTGLGNGIAIPHGKLAGSRSIMGSLGISDKGIDYDALDGKPVYVVFLFTSGISMTDEHLGVLSDIARLVEIPHFADEIRAAASPASVNRLLAKYGA